MTATPTAPTDRFIAVGITEVLLVKTVAAADGIPSRTELDAVTTLVLTAEIKDWAGWTTTSERKETPDLKNSFVGEVKSRVKPDASSLTLYGDRLGVDIRAEIAEGELWHVVFADHGLDPTMPMDVFAVEIADINPVRTVEDPFAIKVDFAIKKPPVKNVPIPAAV